MIKAYLEGIASQYEGEDIEVRYSIYEDQELLCKEFVILEYRKPAIVGQVALVKLLKGLEKYMGKEIVIIISDPALYEIIRGTSTTKNRDVLEMAIETRKEYSKFENIIIKDVSEDRIELAKWHKALQA